MLQGRSLRLHPGLVLVAVAAGSTLFGIAGAFLSVPVAAVGAVIVRYLGEVIEGRPADQARSTTTAESDADTGAHSSESDEERADDEPEPDPVPTERRA